MAEKLEKQFRRNLPVWSYDLRPSQLVTDRAPTIPRSHEPRRSCRRLRPTDCLATVPQMRTACRRRRRT
eukprot:scaffold46212_cov69-Phaeocystis_antarctica.AAC.2